MAKQFTAALRQWIFPVVAGAIFSVAYAIHSPTTEPGTRTIDLATFHSFAPYGPRFLVAYLAYHLFGASIVDWLSFRAAMSFVCWILSVALLVRFSRRIQVSAAAARFLMVSFTLIMLAHYCLPNVYAPYYIYDMPSILFYLLVFLLSTDKSIWRIFLGCLLAVLFSLNRESITLALFHAFAWWFGEYWEIAALPGRRHLLRWPLLKYLPAGNTDEKRRLVAMASIAVALVATGVLRFVVVHWLYGPFQTGLEAALYEGSEIRVIANVKHLFENWGTGQQFVAIGFGAVFYLGFVLRHQSLRTRSLLIGSILPFLMMIFVANFVTELRVYNEYIPLFACLLAIVMDFSRVGAPASREDKPGALERDAAAAVGPLAAFD